MIVRTTASRKVLKQRSWEAKQKLLVGKFKLEKDGNLFGSLYVFLFYTSQKSLRQVKSRSRQVAQIRA